MKKTMFIRFFRAVWLCLTTGIIIVMAMFLLGKFMHLIGSTPLIRAFHIHQVTNGINSTLILGVYMLFFSLVALYAEITNRLIHDDCLNLWNSIAETFKAQHFMKRQDVTTVQLVNGMPTNSNRVIQSFNRAVRKSVVDIRNDSVVILIKLPRTQQAQALFKTITPQLREYLSNQMVNYYFSEPTRKKNTLWFEGKKR